MKYYKLADTPELSHAPKLKDWYGRFEVRNITLKGFPNLPDRELIFVESEPEMKFTDIVRFPFLLISPQVKKVIKMYREVCFTKEIVLYDQKNDRPELYYLPVLEENDQIQLVIQQYEDGRCTEQIGQPTRQKATVSKHLFWVTQGDKRHTILSLDLAESLIRRGVTGLGLKEVQLYQKEEER